MTNPTVVNLTAAWQPQYCKLYSCMATQTLKTLLLNGNSIIANYTTGNLAVANLTAARKPNYSKLYNYMAAKL